MCFFQRIMMLQLSWPLTFWIKMPSLHHFILLFHLTLFCYWVTAKNVTSVTFDHLNLITQFSSTNGSSSQIWSYSLEAVWDEWNKHKRRDNLKTWCLWPWLWPAERHKGKAYNLMPSVQLSSDCSSFLSSTNDKLARPVLTTQVLSNQSPV